MSHSLISPPPVTFTHFSSILTRGMRLNRSQPCAQSTVACVDWHSLLAPAVTRAPESLSQACTAFRRIATDFEPQCFEAGAQAGDLALLAVEQPHLHDLVGRWDVTCRARVVDRPHPVLFGDCGKLLIGVQGVLVLVIDGR